METNHPDERMKMRMTQKPRHRQRLSIKMKYSIAVISMVGLVIISTLLFNFSFQKQGLAAASGDYRSKATGNWNNTATWEKYNGTSWVAATATPTNADGVVTIQNGHTVTNTTGIDVDQLVVESGASLSHTNGTLKITDSLNGLAVLKQTLPGIGL